MSRRSKISTTVVATSLAITVPAIALAQETAPAEVTVDFSKSRGAYLHPERYNNVSRARTFPEQRDADVEFLNANGLHGKVYKVWVDAHLILDAKTGVYNYDGITDYLSDLSRLSETLLVVMDTRVMVRDAGATPEQVKPVVKTILRELKQRFPKIVYIEAFNEPDHNLAKVVKPGDLYAFYKPYYEAVNELNRELKPKVPMQIGGPGFMQYNELWTNAFLDDFKADRTPGKRIDFFSWHGYGRFPEGTGETTGPRAYHFYKFDPSEVASERGRFEKALTSRGLNTKIPAFITETGIYPGPSFDNAKDPHADALTGAAGVTALHYWYMENPRTIPFNWVMRHFSEERKDQLATRAGAGNPIPTRTFTPYGNAMAMQAKLKDRRVAARSNALVQGKGVYAIATSDKSGAAVMVWNYQHTDSKNFDLKIDLGRLPANLKGKTLRERRYRIDQNVSNYWTDPAKANLQMVSETIVVPTKRHSVSVTLTPNALELVELEPVSTAKGK
ncbi:cellulase family glycosylhydrolase [Novosphingobium sp. MW5]|nr:cellulase family glycosylhydrolase [Novosphingobium sp. MW5]